MTNIEKIEEIPSVYAACQPDKIAIRHFAGAISYSALDRYSNQVANGIAGIGIASQSRIILLSKNDPRIFEIFFGAVRAGMALTPANWRLTAEELCFIINDSEAPLLFVSAEYAPLIDAVRGELPLLGHVITLSDGQGDYEAWRDAQSAAATDRDIAQSDDVLQLYTSGTTGLPKGAMLTEGNLMAYLRSMAASCVAPFPEGSLVLVPLPMFHVGGFCWGMNALFHGEADLILREASAPLIIDAFRRFTVTKAGLVPAIMKMVIEHPDVAKADFSHLDTVTYGAAPISPDLLARARVAFGCGFVQMFGMTESCSLATFLSAEDHDPDRPEKMLSVGKLSPGMGLRIIGGDGKDLPLGESGEILLSGPNIMKGYWRRPEATALAIIDDWYHSGDVGCLDDDGFLYIHDRIKDMIISGGENVYSAEVEKVLSSLEGVADVAVIGVPDPIWGEAVKAIVIRRPGAMLSAGDVTAYARSRMAAFKCPKSVDFVDAIPRNAGGKILKRILRDPYWKDKARGIA